jgi:hypothetical protein
MCLDPERISNTDPDLGESNQCGILIKIRTQDSESRHPSFEDDVELWRTENLDDISTDMFIMSNRHGSRIQGFKKAPDL